MDCRGGETARPLTPRQRQGSLGGCHVAEPKVSLLSGLGRSNYLSSSHQCDIPSMDASQTTPTASRFGS